MNLKPSFFPLIRFKESIFSSLAIILIGMVGPFLLSVGVTRYLEPTVRGELSTVIAGVFIASFLGTLGLPNSLAALASKRELSRKLLVQSQFVMIASTSVFSIFVGLFFITEGILRNMESFALILIFTNSICQFIFYSLFINLSGKFRHKALLSIAILSLNLAGLLCIVFLDANLLNCLMIYVCVAFFTFAIAVKLGNTIFKFNSPSDTILPRKLKQIMYDALSKSFIYVSAYDSLKLDLLFIYLICSLEDVGNYAAISTLCLFISVIQRAFSIFFSPLIFEQIAHDRYRFAVRLVFKYLLIILIVGIILGTFLQQIVDFLFGDKYSFSPLSFALVWLGNAFFQARKLLFDFYRDIYLGKAIPNSEIIALFVFVLFIFLIYNKDLLSFAVVYFFSLLSGFIIALSHLRKYQFKL